MKLKSYKHPVEVLREVREELQEKESRIAELESALNGMITRLIPAWQPIETAPKNGTKILAVNNRGNQCVCLFQSGLWHSVFSGGPSSFINGGCGSVLTHWMPLPVPPKHEKGEGV